jgi:hypothetical protein
MAAMECDPAPGDGGEDEGWIVGIDEAGRGPVLGKWPRGERAPRDRPLRGTARARPPVDARGLMSCPPCAGPMVYGVCFCPIAKKKVGPSRRSLRL